ncbi:MAG TPA: hypothetical protein VGN52_26345 [Burkholderiales bacterium]
MDKASKSRRSAAWKRRGAALAVALACVQMAVAQVCVAPGDDGPVTVSASGTVVNTYYAGSSASVSAGATSIGVGTPTGAATVFSAGDMALVIQMQGATYSNANFSGGSTYGDGGSGSGYTGLNGAGRYEFVRITGAVAGGSVGLIGGGAGGGLINSYSNSGASRYQVVRVPQYSSLTVSGGIVPGAWTGNSGGVVALDVAGTLAFGGGSISAAGMGFRGGLGRAIAGSNATVNTDDCAGTTVAAHGAKGEGIAGQSRDLNQQGAAATGANNYTCSSGSPAQQARGAPGNAGGGGNDANPSANDQNAGGGGGAGFSNGGKGGNSWSSNLPFGGYGGTGVPQTVSLLTMGGGGGAGARNNSAGIQSSGADGGGIVIIRAGRITGNATIDISGASGQAYVPDNDGGGGGGGGGAALILASNAGTGTLTINASGGRGSDAWPTDNGGTGDRHGPGGGGGGGYVAYSSGTVGAIANINNGANGITTTLNDQYGAAPGVSGSSNSGASLGQVPGVSTGSACLPQVTVTKQTVAAQPVTLVPGSTVRYRITATNASGRGDAENVTLSDVLPGAPAWQYQSTAAVNLTGGSTRPTTTNPAANATTPAWSLFNIPGGGAVSLDFDVLIGATAAAGTYQNPANTTYRDPTRTTINGTVTPGGTYAGGGTVGGSNYIATSTTLEDVTIATVSPVAVNKVFSPASDRNSPFNTTMTITINNPGTATVNNITVTDPYPLSTPNNAQLNDNGAVSNSCGGTATFNNGTHILTVGTFTLAPGQSCSIVRSITAPTSTTTRTYSNTATVSATAMSNVTAGADYVTGNGANAPPVLTKTIGGASSFTIAAGGTANMVLTINNTNTTAMGDTNPIVDTFPSGMSSAAGSFVSRQCNGLADTTRWSNSGGALTLTLGATTINAGSNCTATVAVTAATPGIYTNTFGAVTVTTPSGLGDSNTANATLRVVGPPTVTKSFAPSAIAPGNISTMSITVTNPSTNPDSLPAVAISDSYAGGLINQGTATLSCVDAGGATLATGTLTGGANGGTVVGFNGATLPAGGSCTITQKVTPAAGTYTNTTGAPATTVGGVTLNGTPASATLTVNTLAPPTVSKAFSAASISPGGTATLTITLSNPNAAGLGTMTLTSPFTDTLPISNTGQQMTVASAGSLSTTCSGAASSTANGVTLASGSSIPAGGCTISVDVKVNSTINSTYVNTIPVGALVTNGGSNAAAASATLLVPGPPTVAKAFAPASINVNGTSTLTITLASPTGASIGNVTLTDTLPTNVVAAGTPAITNTCGGAVSVSNTTPQSVILTSGTVPAAGCAFSVNVTSSVAGVYDNNIPGSNLTSSGGNSPNGIIASARLTVGATNTISGRVFLDNGAGAGNANDGILTSGEGGSTPGIANLQVQLTNCSGTVSATTQTDGSGNYSFSGPAASATVCVVVASQPGTTSTGANVNATALPTNTATAVAGTSYTFCRASGDACVAAQGVRSIRFAYVAGTTYGALNFGQVPGNQYVSNGAQQGPAGSSFSYIQAYTANTAGSVTFTPVVTSTAPSISGWNEVLHLDTNCDGSIAASETTIVTSATVFPVTAGQKICLVLTEFSAAAAPDGAMRVITVTSNFTYTNANPALPALALAVVDTTTVGSADGLTLRKEVCNSTTQVAAGSSCDASLTGTTAGRGFALSNAGSPGDVLIYRLIYSNPGTKPTSNLVINDTTPPYTVSAAAAACGAAPAGMACTVAAQPTVGQAGNYRWTFTGSFPPASTGVVLMTISITPQ